MFRKIIFLAVGCFFLFLLPLFINQEVFALAQCPPCPAGYYSVWQDSSVVCNPALGTGCASGYACCGAQFTNGCHKCQADPTPTICPCSASCNPVGTGGSCTRSSCSRTTYYGYCPCGSDCTCCASSPTPTPISLACGRCSDTNNCQYASWTECDAVCDRTCVSGTTTYSADCSCNFSTTASSCISAGCVKYSCSGSTCVAGSSGSYTTADCNGACVQHYACSGASCVVNASGSYTTSDCNGACVQHYACSGASCVVNASGSYTTSDCNGACDNYSCSGSTCIAQAGGTYSNYSACISSGCETTYYYCNGGSCYEGGGSYTTSDCNNACDNYNCVGSSCVLAAGGTYSNYSACISSGCETTYYCSGGACYVGSGSYTSSDCNNACDNYSCSAGVCVLNPGGAYANQGTCLSACTSQVTGYVYTDTDRDGVRDVGEAGRSGQPLSYRLTAGGTSTNITTNATGLYSFSVLPGNYTITLGTIPVGFESSDGITVRTVNVTGGNVSGGDFGIVPLPTATPTPYYTIKGYLFYDYNSNSIFEKTASKPETCYDKVVTISFCGIQNTFDPTSTQYALDPVSGCRMYNYTCSNVTCYPVTIQGFDQGYFVTGWTGTDNEGAPISGESASVLCND